MRLAEVVVVADLKSELGGSMSMSGGESAGEVMWVPKEGWRVVSEDGLKDGKPRS